MPHENNYHTSYVYYACSNCYNLCLHHACMKHTMSYAYCLDNCPCDHLTFDTHRSAAVVKEVELAISWHELNCVTHELVTLCYSYKCDSPVYTLILFCPAVSGVPDQTLKLHYISMYTYYITACSGAASGCPVVYIQWFRATHAVHARSLCACCMCVFPSPTQPTPISFTPCHCLMSSFLLPPSVCCSLIWMNSSS